MGTLSDWGGGGGGGGSGSGMGHLYFFVHDRLFLFIL